jgi:[ribosomal protein S18]-alanine N-acetyltransferase
MKSFLSDLFSRVEARLSTAGPADAAAMAEVHAQAFRRGWSEEEFERLLADAHVIAERATAGRELVGFSIIRIAADEAEILSIAVKPSWRRRGLAGHMLDLQLRRLAGCGVARLFLEVDEGNMAARRLYARAQFREVGRRNAYYRVATDASPSAALIMRRDLA